MKKKIYFIFPLIIIIIALITGGVYLYIKKINDNWQSKISKKIESYQEVVEDSTSSFESVDTANDWLISWANSKNISYTKYGNNVLLMARKSSEEFKSQPTTILFCDYDTDNPSGSVRSIAIAMSILKSDIEFGELKVIFAADKDRSFNAINSIPSEEIGENSSIFVLTSGNKQMFSLMTGGSKAYSIEKQCTFEDTTKDVALKISVNNAPGGVPDTKISNYPNGVTVIGNFLAKLQSDAINFELASFNGGQSSSLYPSSTEAIIVVNKDDVERIATKLDTLKENFLDKYQENYEDVMLDYEQLQDVPEKVINKSDSSKLLSLIYTMINGIYYKDDDGEVVAISSINMVNTDSEVMQIKMNISSLSSAKLGQMEQNISTLAGLSEFNLSNTNTVPIWSKSRVSDFATRVKECYKRCASDELQFVNSVPAQSTSALSSRFKKNNILCITSTEDSLTEDGKFIMTYLMGDTKIL